MKEYLNSLNLQICSLKCQLLKYFKRTQVRKIEKILRNDKFKKNIKFESIWTRKLASWKLALAN